MRAEDIKVSNLLDIVTSSNGDGGTFDELISGVWLAEVCLWVCWQTRGVAEFVLHGEVLSRRASGVRDVLADLPRLANLAHAYSKPLVDVLRSTAAHTSLSDVNSHGSADTASHDLCRLNNEHRLVLSRHVLASMKTASKGKLWQKSLRELELEVRSYKSSLLFVNEEPERVVFLSVIEVRSW